jgi:hypothetical protein
MPLKPSMCTWTRRLCSSQNDGRINA